MISLIAPIFLMKRNRSFMAMGFMILMLLSMVSEDTLETAAGASFIGFFYSLFVFGPDFPWLKSRLFKNNARKA